MSDARAARLPKVTYWAGRGRCEPCDQPSPEATNERSVNCSLACLLCSAVRCLLAIGGCEFENVFMKGPDDLAELRATGKLAYDQLPLVEIDGLNLVQGAPSAVYLAQKFNLWPAEPKDQFFAGASCSLHALKLTRRETLVRVGGRAHSYDLPHAQSASCAGHVFAAAQDARGPMVGYPFHLDIAKLTEELSGPKGLLGRFAPKWEGGLSAHLVESAVGKLVGALCCAHEATLPLSDLTSAMPRHAGRKRWPVFSRKEPFAGGLRRLRSP